MIMTGRMTTERRGGERRGGSDEEESDEDGDDDNDAKLDSIDLGLEDSDDFGKMVYRLMVVAYFVLLPSYFWYRWLYTIEWDVPYRMYYQSTICVAEMFGAICVMMLAVIRFPQPWAYNQMPPRVAPKIKPRYPVHCCVPCYNEPSDIVFAMRRLRSASSTSGLRCTSTCSTTGATWSERRR